MLILHFFLSGDFFRPPPIQAHCRIALNFGNQHHLLVALQYDRRDHALYTVSRMSNTASVHPDFIYQIMPHIRSCHTSYHAIHQIMPHIRSCHTSDHALHQIMPYIRSCPVILSFHYGVRLVTWTEVRHGYVLHTCCAGLRFVQCSGCCNCRYIV